jgi:ABC-type transport system involved in cytochrome c biogenesis permease subunit
MIVATGMSWRFFFVLLRFLRRVLGGGETTGPVGASARRDRAGPRRRQWLVPAAAVLLGAVWVAGKAVPSRPSADEVQWERFGALPVMHEGRIKPFDTLARSSLRVLSGRETFLDEEGKQQPAIRWLLDVIARPDDAVKHRVFRIEASELRDTLGLERRKGARYSWEEIGPESPEFRRLAMLARRQEPRQRAFQQKKMEQLVQQVNYCGLLAEAFRPLPLPPVPTKEEMAAKPEAAARIEAAAQRLLREIPAWNRSLESRQPPLAAPAGPAEQPWLAYAAARNDAFAIEWSHQGEPAPATMKLAAIFDAYRQGRVQAFNEAVGDYETWLADAPPAGLNLPITRFEAYFNHFAPFYHLIYLYVGALVLTVVAWLVAMASPRWSALLRSSAFWLIVLTFTVHTFALAARVVISGRPPVTNLYSSAVFMGWGCVAIGLLLELVFRLGIGNFVSVAAGIGTLIIAHFLAADGDTIKVLQAVLDTQFWLTVHVLAIMLGYSAMFLAGLLGLASIACSLGRRLDPPSLSAVERILDSMIYGVTCFAALFSLVGTVLGGLWADYSWGRFWGWDPKENGALIIVLWTAVVLHARASRMVGPRGMAILAVGGIIITSWSWFGVNELGVGLHSYGFTEGVAAVLQIVWISSLAIMGVAAAPILAEGLFARRPPSQKS